MQEPKMGAALSALIISLGMLSTALAADRIQAVSSADGRLEIFVKSNSGRIYHAWQTQVESGAAATHWHWEKTDTKLGGDDFVAGRDSKGRLFVAAIENGVIRFNAAPMPGAAFGNAQPLDTHHIRGLRVAASADGRIELFSVSTAGVAWSTAETAAGNRTFANHNLGGTQLRSLAPTSYKGGRLALVALGGDRSVWWTSQVAPNAGWNNWSSLGGHDLQAVAAAANADGRLDVVALGANKALYHRYEVPGGGFSGWETFAAGPFREPVSLVRNADARLEVFLHNDMGQIVHAWQLAPNGGWSNITVLENIPRDTRTHSVTMMPDGRLVIAALGYEYEYPEIYIAGQVQPNSAWQAWLRPRTAEPPAASKPSIDFKASPNNAYGPIGTTFNFSWNVLHCGSDCNVSLVGKTGLGTYDTVFFNAANLKAQGQIDVKPQDTNTLYILTAQSPAGSADNKIEGKLYGTPAPDPCAGCMKYFFKLVPPSNLLSCAKKMYLATAANTAEEWAKAEFPGWKATTITESQFFAVGC